MRSASGSLEAAWQCACAHLRPGCKVLLVRVELCALQVVVAHHQCGGHRRKAAQVLRGHIEAALRACMQRGATFGFRPGGAL